MTQLRNTFDSESLGALESVIDEVHRELAGDDDGSEARPNAVSREQLARIILHHAQTGESDPVKLRALLLKVVGRR